MVNNNERLIIVLIQNFLNLSISENPKVLDGDELIDRGMN